MATSDRGGPVAVRLGVVPTHLGFVGGLIPRDGRLPRGADGRLAVAAEMADLAGDSPVEIGSVMISTFPGTDPGDYAELVEVLRELGLEVHMVMMVGGADPLESADTGAVVDMLCNGLETAARHGITRVASTSLEEWMQAGAQTRTGAAFEAAVEQVITVHEQAYRSAGLAGSGIAAWEFEFLRPGEFRTFTRLDRVIPVIRGLNERVGRPFFKALVDAAHCGDSGLSLEDNIACIESLGASGELGSFHASAKTTRGHLSTDGGWIRPLLEAASNTGALTRAFVEIFRHDDPALAGLRSLDPGHGVDTVGEQGYHQAVIDGLVTVNEMLTAGERGAGRG